jgi:hypothetical protein
MSAKRTQRFDSVLSRTKRAEAASKIQKELAAAPYRRTLMGFGMRFDGKS